MTRMSTRRVFGRRKILCTEKLLVLILVSLVLAQLFIISKYESLSQSLDNADVINIQQHNDTSSLETPPESIHSICPQRSTLDNKLITLYSNRTTNETYYLTIGIPTVIRKNGHDYLKKTLESLLKQYQSNDNALQILIVIFLADININVKKKLADEIYRVYGKFVEAGTLDIIQAPSNFYPKPPAVKRRFGDSEDRVKWRSKQAVDYSFLLCYCHGLAKYHLQLEDDIVAVPLYLPKLKQFIEDSDKKKKPWFSLDLSILGYIGKVYHNDHIRHLANFFYIFFDEMPVDWLEYSWRDLKGQKPRFNVRMASLFQHVGFESSLHGKKQKRVEPYLDKYSQKFLGLNPPAILLTNLIEKLSTKTEDAYQKGGGFFWGICPNHTCFIKVIFKDVVKMKEIFIGTGSNFARKDKIKNGTLITGSIPQGKDCLHYDNEHPINFVNGEVHKGFVDALKVNCLKITMQSQNTWVVLREIDVWTE